jgi:hypothetical protein
MAMEPVGSAKPILASAGNLPLRSEPGAAGPSPPLSLSINDSARRGVALPTTNMENNMSHAAVSPVLPTRFLWAKRLGLVASLFLFVKGLAWIAVLARSWWLA